jgi:cytochrome c oxidase subunit III
MGTQVIPLPEQRPAVRPLRKRRGGSRRPVQTPPAVPDAVVGTLIFLGAEAMFFAGLISAYLVLRAGSTTWPPPDQPRLPIAVTAVNTLILLYSGYTMRRAVHEIRADRMQGLSRWLGVTVLLGVTFLLVQGTEWVRLVSYGLHVTSGTYGATFYTLIGCHGLHVLGGVVVLLTVLWHALQRRLSARDHAMVDASSFYWFFVVGVWPVLYGLVYLL